MSRISQRLWAKLTTIAHGLNHPCELRWLVLACILAPSLAAPTAARAAAETYPGANCVFASKGTDWALNRGGLYNRNPANRERARVDCPIIKERPGAAIASASVFVVAGSASVSCELVGVVGTTDRLGPTRHSSAPSSTPQELDLSPFDPPSFGTIWFIGCSVPSGGGILSYQVDQR